MSFKSDEVEKTVEPKLNADGLVPGAPVDFDTINRINRSRSPEEQAKASKNLQQPLKK